MRFDWVASQTASPARAVCRDMPGFRRPMTVLLYMLAKPFSSALVKLMGTNRSAGSLNSWPTAPSASLTLGVTAAGSCG